MNRIRPSFFIIGERKCGTSSLFRYLCDHPAILPGRLKESHFFSQSDKYISNHLEEYFDLFPLRSDHEIINHWAELGDDGKIFYRDIRFAVDPQQPFITGEASANVFSTVNPGKLKKYLPDIKLILILRDPVARAFSHYAMHQRFKSEGRFWFQFVTNPIIDFSWEQLLIRMGIDGPYISPGRYILYLKKWLNHFPMGQFYILLMEDLEHSEKANHELNDLTEFLGLEPHDYREILKRKFNTSPFQFRNEKLEKKLELFYKPYNEQLELLLERKLNWS